MMTTCGITTRHTHKTLTEYVKEVTEAANEFATSDKKSTIMPEHVLRALGELGFGAHTDDVRATWEQLKEETKSERHRGLRWPAPCLCCWLACLAPVARGSRAQLQPQFQRSAAPRKLVCT